MPLLFHATVGECAGVELELQLRIISAEQPSFYSGRAFALMLLYDPIQQELVREAPLARVVSFEQTMEKSWLDEHVNDYIDDAVLVDLWNEPISVDLAAMSGRQRTKFFASPAAPHAVFAISVTKPEWIAHLRTGMQWDSAGYDPWC